MHLSFVIIRSQATSMNVLDRCSPISLQLSLSDPQQELNRPKIFARNGVLVLAELISDHAFEVWTRRLGFCAGSAETATV